MRWKTGEDLSPFAGKPIRLRVQLRDTFSHSGSHRESWLPLDAVRNLCCLALAGCRRDTSGPRRSSWSTITSLNLYGLVRLPSARTLPGNPILTGTEPWEKWLIELNGRSVVYDEQRSEFRMYYGANLRIPTLPPAPATKCASRCRGRIALAAADLGLVEWEGSTRTTSSLGQEPNAAAQRCSIPAIRIRQRYR